MIFQIEEMIFCMKSGSCIARILNLEHIINIYGKKAILPNIFINCVMKIVIIL